MLQVKVWLTELIAEQLHVGPFRMTTSLAPILLLEAVELYCAMYKPDVEIFGVAYDCPIPMFRLV
jgi:hypothetical protein